MMLGACPVVVFRRLLGSDGTETEHDSLKAAGARANGDLLDAKPASISATGDVPQSASFTGVTVSSVAADSLAAIDMWRQSLLELTSTEEAAYAWRQHRYAFAHRLGMALVGGDRSALPTSGSVVYGVWLNWGLIYVGQTGEAQRRLRDLPVGESHHLANTFPPEIWSRVIVIEWPQLTTARATIERLSEPIVGLALEHRLQASLTPLANASRRKPDGGWRAVTWSKSQSRAARAAMEIDELYESVMVVWTSAARSGPSDLSSSLGCVE